RAAAAGNTANVEVQRGSGAALGPLFPSCEPRGDPRGDVREVPRVQNPQEGPPIERGGASIEQEGAQRPPCRESGLRSTRSYEVVSPPPEPPNEQEVDPTRGRRRPSGDDPASWDQKTPSNTPYAALYCVIMNHRICQRFPRRIIHITILNH